MDINKKFIVRGVVFVLFCVAIAIGVIVFIEYRARQTQYQNFENKIQLITSSLRPSEFSNLSGTNYDLDTANYQAIKAQFIQIGKFLKSENVRWIYAMRSTPEGIIFLSDSVEPSDSSYASPGTIYEEPPDILKNNFDQPSPFFYGPYTDEYGIFISAFVPLFTSDGKLTAIIGGDIDYTPLHQSILARRLRMIGMTVGVTTILLTIYYFAFRIFEIKRLVTIQQKEIEISKNKTQTATSQTEKRTEELERLNKFMVNRELKMIELKKEIEQLKGEKS